MSKELQIPLLKELISRGEPEPGDLLIEADDEPQIDPPGHSANHDDISRPEPVDLSELENDESLEDFSSIQELVIEEEVRTILDKHMENAYEEIIRLIHHRLNH
jgi:hypothetical protein